MNEIGEVRGRNRENLTGTVLTCQSCLLYVLLSIFALCVCLEIFHDKIENMHGLYF